MIKIDHSGKSAMKRTQKRLIFLVVRFYRPIIRIMVNAGEATLLSRSVEYQRGLNNSSLDEPISYLTPRFEPPTTGAA
jgi:hypothetical protein